MAGTNYFSYFSKENGFTIDDLGNIGITDTYGCFNTNMVATDVSTEDVLKETENQKYFFDNIKPLDVYHFSNNIIYLRGQDIPIYGVRKE